MDKLELAKAQYRAYNFAWILLSALSKPKAITALEEIMDKLVDDNPGADE